MALCLAVHLGRSGRRLEGRVSGFIAHLKYTASGNFPPFLEVRKLSLEYPKPLGSSSLILGRAASGSDLFAVEFAIFSLSGTAI